MRAERCRRAKQRESKEGKTVRDAFEDTSHNWPFILRAVTESGAGEGAQVPRVSR